MNTTEAVQEGAAQERKGQSQSNGDDQYAVAANFPRERCVEEQKCC